MISQNKTLLAFVLTSVISIFFMNLAYAHDDTYYLQQLILLNKSKCNPTVTGTLRGISYAENSDTIYYLTDGSVWRQYNIFNGMAVQRKNSVYTYQTYKNRPKVKIYREPNSLTCKIQIAGGEGESFVYRGSLSLSH